MSRIIIYLVLLLPAVSSDLPESRPGKPVALCLVLLRMGFTCAPPVTRRAVVSYTALPPLPFPVRPGKAVHFCCTVPGVASARRYLAPCPVKPGLSSPAALRYRGSGHLSYSQRVLVYHRIMGLSRETMFLLPTLFPANHVAFPCIPTADSLCIS